MATTPNDLTRQQLDDLDALLQRMLNVPVAAKEPVAMPHVIPNASVRVDPPAQAPRVPHLVPEMKPAPQIFETRVDPRSYLQQESPMSSRLFGQPMPVEDRLLPPVIEMRAASYTVPESESFTSPLSEKPFPSIQSFDDEPNITVDSPEPITFQQATEIPGLVEEPAVPLTMVSEPPAQAMDDRPLFAPVDQVPLLGWPVYACNRLIEAILNLFGPPGELFTTPAMKWLLGLGGIGLLCAAGAWAARGMGWVQW